MRRVHALVFAVFILAVATACGTAYAGGNVSVTPATAEPGDLVEVSTSECHGADGATATSDGFVRPVRLRSDGFRELTGRAEVREDAEPRRYRVRVECDDNETVAVGSFEIKDSFRPPQDQCCRHGGDCCTKHGDWQRPVSPVHAGGGGTARVTAAEEPGVPAALPLTGIAASAVTLAGFAVHRRLQSRLQGGRLQGGRLQGGRLQSSQLQSSRLQDRPQDRP
jgi:hypothetical protein